MEKLKICGAWSGVLEVEFDEWTVQMLREEVAKRSHGGPEWSIKLISAGTMLKDGDGNKKLSELGFKNNAKVLAIRMSEEERFTRLERLKAAAISLAKRHADGPSPVEGFDLELENQSGEKVILGSQNDQLAIAMGLMLHLNAQRLIRGLKYKDASEVLALGEEAFSLCNNDIGVLDNVPMLQIDMVWCYFMLRDISSVLVEGIQRLAKAREGIQRACGKEPSHVLLQQGRHQELAIHLRLELLEGVVEYHNGNFEKSRNALTSAQTKYFQLHVPDEALSQLMSKGYKECDAKLALRLNDHNVESANKFLVEEAKELRKNQRREEIREQREYGTASYRKALDPERLDQLINMGFGIGCAAEALRRNENDIPKAVEDLTNSETESAIVAGLLSSGLKKLQQSADTTFEDLISSGISRAIVDGVVRAYGTKEQAYTHLVGLQPCANATVASASDGNDNSSEVSRDEGSEGSPPAPPSSSNEVVDDMGNDKLIQDLLRGDFFPEDDIEVTKECEAINEYLTLLTYSQNVEKSPSSE